METYIGVGSNPLLVTFTRRKTRLIRNHVTVTYSDDPMARGSQRLEQPPVTSSE